MNIKDFPKYLFDYIIEISNIKTSLDMVLKMVRKQNQSYRDSCYGSYRGNIIHYQIKRDAKKVPISITLKVVGVSSEGSYLLYQILEKHIISDDAVQIKLNLD